MQNNIQVFENAEFGKLEVLMIEDKPYFPATECAETLGYSRARDAVSRHCRYAVKHGVPHPQSPEKVIDKVFIPEGDLYRLIFRSKLPAAVRFESWVCDEVLPSIRKHGAYINDETLKKLRESEKYAEFLMDCLEQESNLSNSLAEFATKAVPKVMYYDIVLQCPEAVQVSIIAKDYGMSAIAFNKLLYKLNVQYRVGKTWLLYAQHQSKGYTVTNTYTRNGIVTMIQTCWTQRGRYWLYNLLKSHGILPEAEKMAAS